MSDLQRKDHALHQRPKQIGTTGQHTQKERRLFLQFSRQTHRHSVNGSGHL